MTYSNYSYIIVGAGLYGAVMAERIASVLNQKVLIIDKKDHIGGASYSFIDEGTKIDIHKYGSHIFHTDNQEVWDYIRKFSQFNTYQHKVLIKTTKGIFFMPINLKTINDFYQKQLSPQDVNKFLNAQKSLLDNNNLESKAISLIGKDLYEIFIKGYTQKQWNCNPALLPSNIITRLPIRDNYNINYFNSQYQGIPIDGYGKLFENMLNHPNITIKLNTNFLSIKKDIPKHCKIIYTGMIDQLYNYELGELNWRSLSFSYKKLPIKDFQGTAVMNYSDINIPYTRIHEFKHYHPEKKDIYNQNKTIICYEYPKNYNHALDAFYPIEDSPNRLLYEKYCSHATQNKNLFIGGRLGLYRYMDMDQTIAAALHNFKSQICVN